MGWRVRSPVGALLAMTNRVPVPLAPRSVNRYAHALMRRDAGTELGATASVSTLFAIVSALANDTAAPDWDLWRKPRPGADPAAPRVQVPNHPALDLWNRPNPFMTTREFIEAVQQHVDLVGESTWVVGTDPQFPAIPLELWPVRPDRMIPIPHPTDYLAGWVYTSPDGEQIPLDRAQVIQVKMPNPCDPYRGLGPVQALLTDLDSARYTAEWNRNFFLNSAEPGGIVEVERRLGDTEFEEMRDRWREQHQGVNNAHRVAILEQAKWVERGYTQRDMQFAELRAGTRDVIREAFRFHMHYLGGSEIGHSRAEAEAAQFTYASSLIVPRLDRLKGALNSQVLALYGDAGATVEFDYCSPVPGDEAAENAGRESKATTFKTLVDAGVHPDDAALVAGLPPMRAVPRPAAQPVGGAV